MSSLNDQKIFNAIFNPNTPFDDESETKIVQTKYEINDKILEAKEFELKGIKAAEQNDSINSIDNFRKAIELAPEWASSYNNRAQALRLFGRTTESLQDLEKAIQLSLKYDDFKVYALALTQKGMILRLEGKNEEALECFKLASSYGNKFAKQQVIALNPYAAMCNKMLSDLFDKVKCGQPIDSPGLTDRRPSESLSN